MESHTNDIHTMSAPAKYSEAMHKIRFGNQLLSNDDRLLMQLAIDRYCLFSTRLFGRDGCFKISCERIQEFDARLFRSGASMLKVLRVGILRKLAKLTGELLLELVIAASTHISRMPESW